MAVEIRYSGQVVTVVDNHGTVTARSPSYTVDVVSGVLSGGMPYEGSYVATPSESAQTLATAGRTLAEDVTIAPIPSNYGRIAWDGTGIMVY